MQTSNKPANDCHLGRVSILQIEDRRVRPEHYLGRLKPVVEAGLLNQLISERRLGDRAVGGVQEARCIGRRACGQPRYPSSGVVLWRSYCGVTTLVREGYVSEVISPARL